jgi:hypothetical protein
VVEARWFFLSRAASGSHYLCIGSHLFIKDGQGSLDHPFDEHADQNTFGGPIGEGPVYLAQMFDQSLFLVFVLFIHYPFFYGEGQRRTHGHHHGLGIDILLDSRGCLSAEGLHLHPGFVHLMAFFNAPSNTV